MEISFFTTLKIGWLNAWIPAFAMVLIQSVYMSIYKDRMVLDGGSDLRSGFCGFYSGFLRLCGDASGQNRAMRHLPHIAQSDVFLFLLRHGRRLHRFGVAVARGGDSALCLIQPPDRFR